MRWNLLPLILWYCQLQAFASGESSKYNGTICAYVDLNYDTFTDILAINQDETSVLAYLASSETLKNDDTFKNLAEMSIKPKLDSKKIVACATGDFNGDSFVDVVLTYCSDGDSDKKPIEAQIWFGDKSS